MVQLHSLTVGAECRVAAGGSAAEGAAQSAACTAASPGGGSGEPWCKHVCNAPLPNCD